MRIKLDEEARGAILKVLAISALILVVLGNILVHMAVFLGWDSALDGWMIIGIWMGNAIIIASLIATVIIASISVAIIKFISKRDDFLSSFWLSSIMDGFIFPIFSIITIIYSFFLIVAVI